MVDSVLINYNLGNTLNELYKGVFNSELKPILLIRPSGYIV